MSEKKYGIAVEDGSTLTRSDEYNMLPEDIEVEFALNGREALHTDDSVDEMALSLLSGGQQQSATVRKTAGNRLKLITGHRRWRAVKKINDNKLTIVSDPSDPSGFLKMLKADPDNFQGPMKLRVKVRELNDEEAFEANLDENMIRDDLTPMDHAHNQRILRERFGWSEERIMAKYKHSRSYVDQLKKAMRLPSEIRRLVQDKKLTFGDARDLAEIPEEQAKEIVQSATDANGDVDREELDRRVRETRIDNSNGTKGKPRTLRQVRQMLLTYGEANDVGEANRFIKKTLAFIDGKMKDETYTKYLDELFDKVAEVESEEAGKKK